MESDYVEIDGSLHEGGGQIIRTSFALSNILMKKFKIIKIRHSRPNAGLNNQLLGTIKLMQEISMAQVQGAKIKSQDVTYTPTKPIQAGEYKGGATTAASINLMLQGLIPTMIFGSKLSKLKLTGGNDQDKAPPSQSLKRIFFKLIERMGIQVKYDIERHGYVGTGAGLVNLEIQPIQNTIKPIQIIERQQIDKIYIELILTCEIKDLNQQLKEFKKDIYNAVLEGFIQMKENNLDYEIETRVTQIKGYPEVYGVVCHAVGGENTFIDASYFPEGSKITLPNVLDQVVKNLKYEMRQGGCLDQHHQDQLLIFMALAEGKSSIRIGKKLTEHTEGSLYVIKSFIPEVKINIQELKENDGVKDFNFKIVEIEGIGLINQQIQK